MNNLLEVIRLKKYFPFSGGIFTRGKSSIRAVDGVSFTLGYNEILGLVGESGCGKTTLGRLILRLVEPTEGEIIFEGKNLLALKRNELRAIRKDMQIIFQDPYSSLNPRMNAGTIIEEPLKIHTQMDKKARKQKVLELLEMVGLRPQDAERYPHEFSGGQRQRIGIARALCLNPKFIVADEPVSALDVSVQAQVINLLMELKERFHLSYLFVSHDLHLVYHLSDRIAVMYLGRIVELGESETIYHHPIHPYTRALLAAIPIPDPETKKVRLVVSGDVPDPAHPPAGCYFHPRCPEVMPICREVYPPWKSDGSEHWVACHLY